MSLLTAADLLTLASWLLSSEQAGAGHPEGKHDSHNILVYPNASFICVVSYMYLMATCHHSDPQNNYSPRLDGYSHRNIVLPQLC